MKRANTHIATSVALIFCGALLMTTVACSSDSTPTVTSSQPAGGQLRPAALQTVVPSASQMRAVAMSTTNSPVKPSAAKLIAYRSRDYGVSFVYPWQYAHVSAKALADVEELRPSSDGHEGQFTLVRIDVPKGFYPDTNFEAGYFALSLNPNLTEDECTATLGVDKDGRVKTDSINGTDFRWVESDSGGHGNALKLRNYVRFANDTCYEVEMAVKTSNEHGLAREVNPDQVLRRLEAILRTVQIAPETQNFVALQAESTTPTPSPDPQQ